MWLRQKIAFTNNHSEGLQPAAMLGISLIPRNIGGRLKAKTMVTNMQKGLRKALMALSQHLEPAVHSGVQSLQGIVQTSPMHLQVPLIKSVIPLHKIAAIVATDQV